MSKVITFFLASSIRDVEYDRLAIGDFINQMNNLYQPLDVFIKLYKCEDESMDHSIVVGGSQKSLDDIIRESDICFVIFWRKAGAVTRHELEVALNAYREHEKPKVVVYFKTIENKDEVPDDIRQIMNIIDNELHHYHREYSHIDSLKLGIITQLNVHGFVKTDISVENDGIMAQGQRIASTADIPLFSENEEYMDLLSRYHEAVDRCEALLSQYNLDKNNARLYRDYQKANKERTRLSEDLTEMVNGMVSIGNSIAKIASSSDINDRIRKAIQCFDSGDYDGVLDILNPDEIESQILILDEMEEQVLIKRRTLIEELRLRILALEAQGRWDEIYKAYENAVSLVIERPDMPKSIIIECARFLERQGRIDESIKKCEWLKSFYSVYPDSTTSIERFELYELLGSLYYDSMRYDEAEQVLKQAIHTIKHAPDADFEINGAKVKLAKVFFKVNRHFESEALYMDALKAYKQFDRDGIQHVDVLIADVSLELGDLYYMINRHEDAEHLFLEAYEKYRGLVNHGESKYRESMAKAGDKAARLSLSVFSHQTSDLFYLESMRVKERLTLSEPSEYYSFFIRICRKLGETWCAHGNNSYASRVIKESDMVKRYLDSGKFSDLDKEEYHPVDFDYYMKPINIKLLTRLCCDSRDIYDALANENPEAYEPALAQSYNTLGILYTQIKDKENAVESYKESIALRELLASRAPQYCSDLAASYSNYAYHCYLFDDFQNSERYSLKAIEIYGSITKNDAGAFENDLARNFNSLAKLYAKTGESLKAEYYYYKALLIYFELFKRSPRAFVDRIINTVANIVALWETDSLRSWFEEFFK